MTKEPESKKRGCNTRIILIIVGVLVACGVLSIIMAQFVDTDTPPAETVATEIPAEPTDPPPPTDTPLPVPTDTPAPTDTPPPTAAPTEEPAGESAEELTYRADIMRIIGLYKNGLDGLAAQSSAAGDTPALMIDDEWRGVTTVYLAAIRLAGEQARELNPPEKFQESHAELLIAAGHFDMMTTLYAEGVDEFSVDKLNRAAESMLLGNEAIQRATALISALNTP